MAVVNRVMESVQGSIEISGEKGKGTTITLKLPLTLAIIDGLLVRAGEGHFVFPLSVVEECVELTSEESARARFRNMIRYRGHPMAYLSLRSIFNIEGDNPDNERVVIVKANGQMVGFGLDHVVGQKQTVIKTLGRIYRNIHGLSGATILGDGTVALILDVSQLTRPENNT